MEVIDKRKDKKEGKWQKGDVVKSNDGTVGL